ERAVRRLAGRWLDGVTVALRKEGFSAVAAVCLVPLAPFGAEMLIAGALRLRLRHVLGGVAIGHLPGMLIVALLGDQVGAALSQDREVNRAIVAAAIALMAVAFFISHRLWQRVRARL